MLENIERFLTGYRDVQPEARGGRARGRVGGATLPGGQGLHQLPPLRRHLPHRPRPHLHVLLQDRAAQD